MRCSVETVVFVVTLRLLDINISSSSPAINTAAYYTNDVSRLTTRGTVAVVHRRTCLQHLSVIALTAAIYRLRIPISAYPTCIGCIRVRGIPVGILPCRLVGKNYNSVANRRWKHFEDIFIRFDRMYERDGQTEAQTDRRVHRMTA